MNLDEMQKDRLKEIIKERIKITSEINEYKLELKENKGSIDLKQEEVDKMYDRVKELNNEILKSGINTKEYIDLLEEPYKKAERNMFMSQKTESYAKIKTYEEVINRGEFLSKEDELDYKESLEFEKNRGNDCFTAALMIQGLVDIKEGEEPKLEDLMNYCDYKIREDTIEIAWGLKTEEEKIDIAHKLLDAMKNGIKDEDLEMEEESVKEEENNDIVLGPAYLEDEKLSENLFASDANINEQEKDSININDIEDR